MIYNHQNKCSGCFLLLKQGVMTRSTAYLFCLPLVCSFQGNCRYGLFAPSPLRFRKALQSLDYKTNISQTEMIDHVSEGHPDSHSLLLKYNVQTKGLRTTHNLRYKVHPYLCLYKTSLFPLLFPHTQKIRDYIFKEEKHKTI